MKSNFVNKLKKYIKSTFFKYRVFKAWKSRHSKVINNGELQLLKLTTEEKHDYISTWNLFGIKVSLDTVEIVKSLTGTYNRYIVPEELYVLIFEPGLNTRKEVVFLENKNIYNKWFGDAFPKDYFHRIDGNYYTKDFVFIENIKSFIESTPFTFPIVIKPSIDTYGGVGVLFINSKEKLYEVLSKYENFVVQEKIIQHKLISAINNSSINTIRVCLLRRPENKEIVVLNASLRMGKDGSLDNETAGGIVCSINEKGVLNEYAVDKYALKFQKHPNSNFIFKDKEIPYYNDLISKSISIANMIVNANIISLDMCLDENNEWRCIETNLFGQTIRFAQYGGKPFFNQYTSEVINFIKNK